MTSIGETLRRERERRRLGVDSIAHELKISTRFLQAIEEDRFDALPGGMFARSWVRQYARLLGLDEDEISAELQRVLEPLPEVPNFADTAVPSEIHVPRVESWQVSGRQFNWSSSLPALALVVVVMLVCSAVYSLWQRSRNPVSAHGSAAAAAPVETASAPAPPPAAEPPVTEPAAAQPPAAGTPSASAPAPSEAPASPSSDGTKPIDRPDAERAAANPPAKSPAAPASLAVERPPASPAAGSQEDVVKKAAKTSPVKVEITASEPVWVLAQGDGKFLFSGTLEANQTRTVEAAGKITLRLGNAGSVHLVLNGRPVGSVGAKGQVRTIQLTSGGWTVAVKPSLPLVDIL